MTILRPSSSSLRAAATLRPAALRAAPRATRTLSSTPRRLAQQDYGSTDSSPKAAKEQPSSSATREKEHPGAAAPDVGQKGSSSASSSSSTSSSGGSKDSHAVKGARPKILDENPPAEESEDVKQHNREMDNRAERADTRISNEDAEKDKVPPGFWSGECSPRRVKVGLVSGG